MALVLAAVTPAGWADAATLKDAYAVFGRYYTLRAPDGSAVDCRSTLELVDRRLAQNLSRAELATRPADLVVVMMNPGSSQPLEADTAAGLVRAKPDTTQYQVMRVMRARGWRHARVLNLSDIRDASSPSFVARVGALEAQHCDAHSIFAASRAAELATALNRAPGAPVLCGWGLNPGLEPLARRALARLPQQALIGVRIEGSDWQYRHPLPMLQRLKQAWVAELLAQLDAG